MKPTRAPKRITWIAPIALTVALITTQWSYPNNRVAPHFTARSALSLIGLAAMGDFDGDLRLDQAELHVAGSHHCVRVRFGDSRESHLEFITTSQIRGAVLSRDVNADSIPDLSWLSNYQPEPSLVWLGDGHGNFTKAPDIGNEDNLLALLSDYPDLELVGGDNDEHSYLTPDPDPALLTRAAIIEIENHGDLFVARANGRRDVGLYLSYLRERGPPSKTSFA